jgi:hypothetical protein
MLPRLPVKAALVRWRSDDLFVDAKTAEEALTAGAVQARDHPKKLIKGGVVECRQLGYWRRFDKNGKFEKPGKARHGHRPHQHQRHGQLHGGARRPPWSSSILARYSVLGRPGQGRRLKRGSVQRLDRAARSGLEASTGCMGHGGRHRR